MKKENWKNKKNIILLLIIVLLIIFAINILSGNKIIQQIGSIAGSRLGESENTSMSYLVYDNSAIYDENDQTNNIKVIVTFSNDNGIEYIIKPNGEKINANGKKEVTIDSTFDITQGEVYKVKEKNGTLEIEKTLNVTIDEIDNEYFEIGTVAKDDEYLNIPVQNKKFTAANDKHYYKVGSNWVEYTDIIKLDIIYLDITKEDQDVYIKKEDIAGNQIITKRTFNIKNYVGERLYLFKPNDQCTDITGGYSYTIKYGTSSHSKVTIANEITIIATRVTNSWSNNDAEVILTSNNSIDISEYNVLNIKMKPYSHRSGYHQYGLYSGVDRIMSTQDYLNNPKIYKINLSDLSGAGKLYFRSYSAKDSNYTDVNNTIYAIWLEK